MRWRSYSELDFPEVARRMASEGGMLSRLRCLMVDERDVENVWHLVQHVTLKECQGEGEVDYEET